MLLCWQLLIWSREANDTHKLDSADLPGGESVRRHFSNGLYAAALSMTMVVLVGGCSHSRSTPEAAIAVSNEVSHELVGKQITIHGRFSLRCKLPACIVLDNQQVVYLLDTKSKSITQGEPYSAMEDKRVSATGILRFYHAPDASSRPSLVARLPDHFYFDADTTQVRLVSR